MFKPYWSKMYTSWKKENAKCYARCWRNSAASRFALRAISSVTFTHSLQANFVRALVLFACTWEGFLPKCDLSILEACFYNARGSNTSLKLDCVLTIQCHYLYVRGLYCKSELTFLRFALLFGYYHSNIMTQIFRSQPISHHCFLLHFWTPMIPKYFLLWEGLYVENSFIS